MDPILTNLSAYGGKWQKELIGQIFLKLEDAGINVIENVKGTTKFWRLRVSKGLKPYTGVFSAADRLNYSDRTLSPEQFQYDIYIDPKKYHNTFATETQQKHSKYFGLPEEAYIWKKVTEEIAEEIVTGTIWKGVKGGVSSNAAENIANGFEKRILDLIAAGKPALTNGVWTSSNAADKAVQLYRDAMAIYPAMRRMKVMMYCSMEEGEKYEDHYNTLYPNDPSNWSETGAPMILRKTGGKCELKPVDWLSGSQRKIVTPMINMALGTDKLSDINVINIVPDVYGLKCGITGTIDLNILDDEACFFNELT